ncbi:MAG: Fur family transcriptional regulator [Thermaerobacterales bacterium]
MTEAVQYFRQLLSASGYRVTPQRLAIYAALTGSRRHPSADDLYSQVREQYPMISPATVYNTLQLLVDLGVATELGFHGETRYDGNPHAHANILCLKCRRIFDIDLPGLEELGRALGRNSDFTIMRQRHEFAGLCPDCRESGQTPAAQKTS